MDFNIPEILRDKGPQSIQSLASQTSTSPQHLLRLLRCLKSVGYFSQRIDGNWENNVNSSNLIVLRPLIHWSFKFGIPTWANTSEGIRTGKMQFSNTSVGNGLEFWDYMQKNPDEGKNFGNAMTLWTNFEVPDLINKFAWEKFNGVKIMDVGSGFGTFLSHILLEKCPRSDGILLDLPSLKEGANQLIKTKNLSNRMEFIGGSFFDPIPTADVILIKSALHNYNDTKCLEILTQCRQALLKSTSEKKKISSD